MVTQLCVLVQNLLTFEGGQATQLQCQNGIRLRFINVEQVHQAGARIVGCWRATNQRNHFIEGIERLEVAFQNVQAFARLVQTEASAPLNDFDLVSDPVTDKSIQRQCARHAVHQGEHIRRERVLQLRALVQVVQDNFGNRVAFENHDQARA